jgi:two-component sensor histidine kinase
VCWNALEHGTPENGVLRIRGRGIDGGRFVIEVEDEGRDEPGQNGALSENGAGGAAVSQLRGTGLKLVEGLVANELSGSFETEQKAAGGTVARVTIPLAEGESARASL